jgi:hypothetical protein
MSDDSRGSGVMGGTTRFTRVVTGMLLQGYTA